MNAREIALKVLVDIEKNNNYSNIAINKHFRGLKINNNDRGLATEIIYGVTENKVYIDYIINKLSKIKAKKMSYYVKILLRIGIYQIVFLDNISDYAAVNEVVDLAKKYDKKSSGFINAILRNVIRNKESITDINEKDKAKYLSIKYSYNQWLIEKFIKSFGQEFTEELIEANNEKSNLYIRVNTLKITRDELMSKLSDMGVRCEKVNLVEEAIKVENLKDIENNELFKQGYFVVQDISSMLVAKVLNPKEGSIVIDMCSAPGGKTTHIATMMNNTGQVISRDIFEHKLKLIKSNVDRLGLNNVKIEKNDASKVNNEDLESADYVLADVPCSGFGIIRRKPEIKYKEEKELKDITKIQRTIIDVASKYVKVGGTLLYSTCTVLDEENIDIVNDFISSNPNFELSSIDEINIDLDNQDKGYIKIYPHIHGIDGFFIAKIKRVR